MVATDSTDMDFLLKGLRARIYKSLLSMLAETTMFGCRTHVHLNLDHHDSSDPAAVLSDTSVVGMLSHCTTGATNNHEMV